MNSNLLRKSPCLNPEGDLQVCFYKSGKYHPISMETFIRLTVSQLCNEAYVLRFEEPTYGKSYFVGSDEIYLKLKSEGKSVRWIHELIEYWRQDLIFRGFPKNTSIYHWRLKDISVLQKSLIIFPASEAEVLKWIVIKMMKMNS